MGTRKLRTNVQATTSKRWVQARVCVRLGLMALALSAAGPSQPVHARDAGAGQSDAARASGQLKDSVQRFEAWAARRATALNGRVSMLTQIELDGRPGPELVARVCHQKGMAEAVLVERDGQRWEVPHASQGHTRVCTGPKHAPPWALDTAALLLTDVGAGAISERRLVIIGSELVVAAEQHAEQAELVQARWDLASQRRARREGRVIPVRENNLAAPEPGTVFVREGAEHWTSEADAELLAVAERRADGSLILRLTLRDDERRIGLSGDRVQVWWSDPQTHLLRGVDVRTDAAGRLRAIALRTQQLPPTVHGTVHELEIVLPWTAPTAEVTSVPMTVVAFDVDAEGTTALATSEFDGRTHSLGLLRYVPGGGDFETAGTRIGDASPLEDLPPPPD